MRFEDLKNEIPETPEFIHMMIQSEVKKQLQETKEVKMQTRRVKKWTGFKVAAAVVACVLVTSTVSYAGVKLYHMILEKQGTYSTITEIKVDGNAGKMNLPDKIHDIDISVGYIPEGMEWSDESHLQYPEHNLTGGFSFASVLLDDDDLDKVMQDQDAIKVVENLVITENDTVIETAGLYTWSEMVSPEEVLGEECPNSIEEDKLPVHQIGESFNVLAAGEDSDGNYIIEDRISVRVDSVQVADNLQLLDQNILPEEWIDVVGADGKLVNNTLSYIKSGDGVDTVDQIVKTESVKQKLVYATVTYTNTSDEEICHMLYIGTLMLMNHEAGRYQIYTPEEQSGEDYDYVIWDGVAHAAEMTYKSVSEDYGNGGNYISSLKPGESIQVNMAWIVNENVLDHMYLNLGGDGVAYEFSDWVLQTGVVDICQ